MCTQLSFDAISGNVKQNFDCCQSYMGNRAFSIIVIYPCEHSKGLALFRILFLHIPFNRIVAIWSRTPMYTFRTFNLLSPSPTSSPIRKRMSGKNGAFAVPFFAIQLKLFRIRKNVERTCGHGAVPSAEKLIPTRR